MKYYGQALLEKEIERERLMKLENINTDALWIDYAELLNDSRLGEHKQKYNKGTNFEHLIYDVMAFRQLANQYYKQLQDDYSHLKDVIERERAYQKELESLIGCGKMDIFKNYMLSLACNKWGGVNHFYDSKGKMWK